MGHATKYIKVDKRSQIMGAAKEFAFYNVDRGEDPTCSYHGWMTIHDKPICSNYEDAVKFIKDHERRSYDDHAVQYRACEYVKENSAIKQLKERRQRNRKQEQEYINNHHVWQRKSEMIGCPCCKSSLSRAYMEILKTDDCPLCRTDLRSTTVQNRLKKFETDDKELAKRIEKEIHKLKDKAPIKWLVKVEVHC